MIIRIISNTRHVSINRILLTLISLPFVLAGFIVGLLAVVIRFAISAFIEGYHIAEGVINADR
jgi:ABC-type sulfate transport system permease subunit